MFIELHSIFIICGYQRLHRLLDTLPHFTSGAERIHCIPKSLAATSSASSATTLPCEPPRSPTSIRSALESTVSLVALANHEDDAEAQIHPLRYTGAGRFWKPPDERSTKHGRLRSWIKRSNRVDNDGVTIPQLPVLNTSDLGIDRGPASPQLDIRKSFSPYQSSFNNRLSAVESRHSFSAQSTVSAKVTPNCRPGSEPGDISSIDMLDEKIDSLAARIAIDERRLRIQEQLKKLQRDEEDRLRQLDIDDSQSSESLTPDLSRNTSDASSRPLTNSPADPKTLHRDLLSDGHAVKITDETQSPATDASNHWDDLRELHDLNLTSSKSSVSPFPDGSQDQVSPEPPPYTIDSIAELPDPQIELSPPPDNDNDSVFSDLDFIVGVLRNKSKSSPNPSQRSRAPTYDSIRNSALVQPKLSPSRKPYPSAVELSAPGPAPPPPTNVFELSSSKSVIHRPEARRQVPRYRCHSDFTAYNTLQGEPFPILKQEERVELPAEEKGPEMDGEVPYDGPLVNIEPEFDPRTGKRWISR